MCVSEVEEQYDFLSFLFYGFYCIVFVLYCIVLYCIVLYYTLISFPCILVFLDCRLCKIEKDLGRWLYFSSSE